MKTYWDYTDKEQAEMTQEQVTALLDVELMTEGVLKPVAPVLEDVSASPLGERKKYFAVTTKGKYGSDHTFECVFETIEQAQSFIALRPFVQDYDYEVGSDYRYVLPTTDTAIENNELYDLGQINQFRSQLKNRKAATERNEKAMSAFKEASGKAERITEGVWKDWYAKRDKASDLKAIVTTFNGYVELTKGDKPMALKFLAKVHSAAEIKEAREWYPDSIYEPPQVLPMPKQEAQPA